MAVEGDHAMVGEHRRTHFTIGLSLTRAYMVPVAIFANVEHPVTGLFARRLNGELIGGVHRALPRSPVPERRPVVICTRNSESLVYRTPFSR